MEIGSCFEFHSFFLEYIESLRIQYVHASGEHSLHTVERKNSFMNFVDKVFSLRENSHIRKFYLSGDNYCKEEHIREWITKLSKQEAQEVHISIRPSFYVELGPGDTLPETLQVPECPYISTIKGFKLAIDLTTTALTFQLPNSMCSAAKLKSLHLVSAILPKGDSNGDLILNCPVLENLVLVECDFSHLNIFTICNLKIWFWRINCWAQMVLVRLR